MPACASAAREAATDIICTVSSGAAQRRCLMPERCWIHSSLESIASMTSELGTTRDGPVGADAEDGGVRRSVGLLDRHQNATSGCSLSSGWPGETRSPSSTSHSTTTPP